MNTGNRSTIVSTQDLLPVRGSDATEILKNDHTVIKQLLTALTSAEDASAKVEMLEQLKGVLTVHNATEEALVYPALDKVAGKHLKAQHLFHETADADTLVFDLDTMLKEGRVEGVAERADKLQAAIIEHIDNEEQSAFPALNKNSDATQMEMLTNSIRDFRRSLNFQRSSV